MAIYHCTIKIISRGKGMSAVGASAYRSGEILKNEYNGITHDFTRKRGIVHTEILLPPHAPPDFADRSTLGTPLRKSRKQRTHSLQGRLKLHSPLNLTGRNRYNLCVSMCSLILCQTECVRT